MGKVSINELTLTNIGAAIREKTGKNDLIAPGDMPAEIRAIVSGGGGFDVEPIVLTGSQDGSCSGELSTQYIKLFPNNISTQDVTITYNMFLNSSLSKIPFDINCKHSTYQNMGSMFSNCQQLEEVPKVNNAYPERIDSFFKNCYRLRTLPDDFGGNWNWSRVQTYAAAYCGNIFDSCYSLRQIPQNLINNLYGVQTTMARVFYYSLFNNCSSLDKIENLPVSTASYTSNAFFSTFNYCNRLHQLTFAPYEGSVKWSNQTIDLTTCGYTTSSVYTNYILNYNSGITADKEIKDSTTYDKLKNDPDRFATTASYSLYAATQAIHTLNSLPTTTGSGCTIKFKSGAGSGSGKNDSMATIPESYIAAAAAKGWTVSFA